MKKTVLVDLDGVLADYSKGWQGEGNIGDPIPGAVQFTKRLSEFARVVIFTSRCKSMVHGRKDMDVSRLVGYVKQWLDKHGFFYDTIYAGQGKPLAAAIVDDRAVSCRPQSPFVSDEETDVSISRDQVWQDALSTCRNFCTE